MFCFLILHFLVSSWCNNSYCSYHVLLQFYLMSYNSFSELSATLFALHHICHPWNYNSSGNMLLQVRIWMYKGLFMILFGSVQFARKIQIKKVKGFSITQPRWKLIRPNWKPSRSDLLKSNLNNTKGYYQKTKPN
jgi:hypothetical protein